MRALSTTELLSVWERGFSETPARRALLLLAAGGDGVSPEELLRSSIGRRDERLFALREKTFGSRLQTVSACPQCGEQLETELDLAELRSGPPAMATDFFLREAGHEIHFRLLNSDDLDCLSPADELAVNQWRLLRQCLLAVTRAGREISPEELPPALVARLAEKMAQADPAADVQLAFTCPACGHAWPGWFDIVSFFWQEINAWAVRLLREVHVLATAYGWSEAEILRLSPARRGVYLQLVGA
jgi:hypothetical protein